MESNERDATEYDQWIYEQALPRANQAQLRRHHYPDFDKGCLPMEAYRPLLEEYQAGNSEPADRLFEGIRKCIVNLRDSDLDYPEHDELAMYVAEKALKRLLHGDFDFDEHGDNALTHYISTVRYNRRKSVIRDRTRRLALYVSLDGSSGSDDGPDDHLDRLLEDAAWLDALNQQVQYSEYVTHMRELLPDHLVPIFDILEEYGKQRQHEVEGRLGTTYSRSQYYRRMRRIRAVSEKLRPNNSKQTDTEEDFGT